MSLTDTPTFSEKSRSFCLWLLSLAHYLLYANTNQRPLTAFDHYLQPLRFYNLCLSEQILIPFWFAFSQNIHTRIRVQVT